MPTNDAVLTLKRQGFFIVTILLELVFVILSLISVSPLIRVVFVFPCLFIIPGMLLLVVLGASTNASLVELSIKAFFVSTILLVLSTAFFLLLYIPLLPITYSATNFGIVMILALISMARNVKVQFRKSSYAFACLVFSSYILVLLFFSFFPRLFSPDETSYIASAVTGISEGLVPPIGIRPHRTELLAFIQGRYFWVYLLCSFIASTGLEGYQAGLLGASFLVLVALASSHLAKEKWVRKTLFLIVCLTPCLFYFSALTLNDLALAFYAVFAVLFFIWSFSKKGNSVSISMTCLLYSVLGLVVLSLIKLNLLVLVVMWLLLVYVLIRYRLYRREARYKFILVLLVLPVLLYELGLDIPYVISVWILQNESLGALFGGFLFVSPAEQLVGWFLAPPWNPDAFTIFSHGITSYLDYFYTLFGPEASNFVFAAVIVSLPLLLLQSPNARKDFRQNILTGVVLLSLALFYFDALGSTYISDVGRLSLWIVPLSIPLALFILRDILKAPSRRNLPPVFLGGLLLFTINLALAIITVGGVWVGFGFEFRLWTIHVVSLQFIALTVILCLIALVKRRNYTRIHFRLGKYVQKEANPKRIVAGLLITLIFINGIYYNSVFIRYSMLFEDHGFSTLSSVLDNHTDDDSLVFANNYIYMRPYVSTSLLHQGLLLPPPATRAELHTLLGSVPNGTLFLISDDEKTTWYEYANDFIRPFAYADFLTATPLNTSTLSNFTSSVLAMTFNDANETLVPDSSGLGNNGTNHGAILITGYDGVALQFNGAQHVSIPDSESLNIRNEIAISFFAAIEEVDPDDHSIILSKGMATTNGSYTISIWNEKIWFSLGDVGSLDLPVEPYLGEWHHFLFTFNGLQMEAYIDGFLVAAKSASGLIRSTSFDVEIGRVTYSSSWHYVGSLDELKISNQSVNTSALFSYNANYAHRIQAIPLPYGQASLFQVDNATSSTGQNAFVRNSQIRIHSNYDVSIETQIESPISENITLLIGSDRFTRVFNSLLTSGLNSLEFYFPVNTSGLYWPYLGQVRLIVIENHKSIYNTLLTAQNTDVMNILLLTSVFGVLVSFCIISYWKFRKSEKMIRRL